MTQTERLKNLLRDKKWHSTHEIQRRVYGRYHLGVARIGARVYDLRKRGYKIWSKKDAVVESLWYYRMEKEPKNVFRV